jgi:2-C-methyl-D-erythritol 4-phosphate cytidylyltransferase
MAVALIVAAGAGQRLGADQPKALVALAGRPLLEWSVEALRQVPEIEEIVVALPAGIPAPEGTVGVRGGTVRSESVRLALAAARAGDPVLVHDAARPLLTAELVNETLAVLAGDDGLDAVIAAAPVADTIKRVTDGTVSETLDRSGLWAIQTPQVFRRAALQRALDVPTQTLAQATDDAWLIERSGGRVAVLHNRSENLKVTTAVDLELAGLLLERRGLA